MTLAQFTTLPLQQKIETLNKLYKGEIKFENQANDIDDFMKGFEMK